MNSLFTASIQPQWTELDIRVKYASAMVLEVVDEINAHRKMSSVIKEAVGLGCNDYWAGINAIPIMFRDVPVLAQSWQRGWQAADDEFSIPF